MDTSTALVPGIEPGAAYDIELDWTPAEVGFTNITLNLSSVMWEDDPSTDIRIQEVQVFDNPDYEVLEIDENKITIMNHGLWPGLFDILIRIDGESYGVIPGLLEPTQNTTFIWQAPAGIHDVEVEVVDLTGLELETGNNLLSAVVSVPEDDAGRLPGAAALVFPPLALLSLGVLFYYLYRKKGMDRKESEHGFDPVIVTDLD